MKRTATEDRRLRDFRRDHLLQRLVVHEARTRTICNLTGYTRHELATLRRRWSIPSETRHRGRAPQSIPKLLRSPRGRSEGAAIAVVWQVWSVAHPPARREGTPVHGHALDAGERYCTVYEAYRAIVPSSILAFEQLMMIASGLTADDGVRLGSCLTCGGSILIDLLGTTRRTCSVCQHAPRDSTDASAGPGQDDAGGAQGKLF